MNLSFRRKTAHFALAILTVVFCVLFVCACGSPVSLDFSLKGEIFAGETLVVEVDFGGAESAVASYAESERLLEVIEGSDVASIADGRVKIAESARGGDAFLLSLTVKDLTVTRRFTVAEDVGPAVESVRVTCDERAEAGAVLPISLEILPAEAAERHAVYTVVSGDATIENGRLVVSDRADVGEIVFKVAVGGVSSEEVRVAVTTRQTRELYLTSEAKTVLPGGSILVLATKVPEVSDFPIDVSLERGADIATFDPETGRLTVSTGAEIPSEITLVARSGYQEVREEIRVDYPEATKLIATGGGVVSPGVSRSFSYELFPAEANRETVSISLVEGAEYAEWQQGSTSFRIKTGVAIEENAEIVFLLKASDDVFDYVSYSVKDKVLRSLEIKAQGSTEYLKSGDTLTFAVRTDPADYDESQITYFIVEGEAFVTLRGNTLTVKDGVGIGTVRIAAESADGTRSNVEEITVCGRYSRRVYERWDEVALATVGENACVWMVLPALTDAACVTVVVPSEVTDLVIEGRYDGDATGIYRDAYFYFRNAASRKVALWNFATEATQGLGGTVMDLGSAGETEICLKGSNLIRADSPYLLDNADEDVDGIWNTRYSSGGAQEYRRRSGKQGYRGSAGGTAISGYSLSFVGEGVLTAVAGNGTDGIAGGNGADAIYSAGVLVYLSGAGGAGGHGGDSGAAIYADSVSFVSGVVTAIPGNAGVGAKGGAAGSTDSLAGRSVTAVEGAAGEDGKNGIPYPAVRANAISGTNYTSSTGRVVARSVSYDGTLTALFLKLSRFYGINLRCYESEQDNPFAKLSKSSRYVMTVQNDETELMHQANFLMYTMSLMPKNCWNEIYFRAKEKKIAEKSPEEEATPLTIYLCKTINAGSASGSTIYGLTSEKNKVWFATFGTEVRGIYYGGYFNIMLHEFVHVFHFNYSDRTTFETQVKRYNYGVGYTTRALVPSKRVYGVTEAYDETNSCFLSEYSRNSVLEDVAETVSIISTFLSAEPPLNASSNIRKKYDLIVAAFGGEYETLSSFSTHMTLFAYPHIFDAAD